MVAPGPATRPRPSPDSRLVHGSMAAGGRPARPAPPPEIGPAYAATHGAYKRQEARAGPGLQGSSVPERGKDSPRDALERHVAPVKSNAGSQMVIVR